MAHAGENHGNAGLVAGFDGIPVSYTHLDVYKRQALALCTAIVIVMVTGCFGYDSYLPAADSLTRIAFSVDCPGLKQTSSPNLTQPENIELVTRLVAQGQQGKAEQRRQEQAELEGESTGTAVGERRFLTIEVTYYPRLGLP